MVGEHVRESLGQVPDPTPALPYFVGEGANQARPNSKLQELASFCPSPCSQGEVGMG
jgi:hypothetical protein